MRVVAVHASDTALAVVCAPNHLLMFAAGSQRLLLEHVLPCTSQTCSVVHLDADTLLAWSGAGEVRSASLARTGLGPPMCASLRVPATALAWHKHGGARQQRNLLSANPRNIAQFFFPFFPPAATFPPSWASWP